jgi:hypothetical protein
LLVFEIGAQVLVALDQALAVELPMLKLLIAVTLDTREESLQSKLMPLAQGSSLLLDNRRFLLLSSLLLNFLQSISARLYRVRVFVVLHSRKCSLLLP